MEKPSTSLSFAPACVEALAAAASIASLSTRWKKPKPPT
jgi:hypothetical protein